MKIFHLFSENDFFPYRNIPLPFFKTFFKFFASPSYLYPFLGKSYPSLRNGVGDKIMDTYLKVSLQPKIWVIVFKNGPNKISLGPFLNTFIHMSEDKLRSSNLEHNKPFEVFWKGKLLKANILSILTDHSISMSPCKRQKTKELLTFSGGTEIWNVGLQRVNTFYTLSKNPRIT